MEDGNRIKARCYAYCRGTEPAAALTARPPAPCPMERRVRHSALPARGRGPARRPPFARQQKEAKVPSPAVGMVVLMRRCKRHSFFKRGNDLLPPL